MTITQGMPVGIVRAWVPWILVGVLIAVAAVWTFWPRERPIVGESVQLPLAKEVKTTPKVLDRVKYVYVYPEKTKAAMNLPPAVVQDKAKKVIATGKLDAEDRPYTLSAVLDTETGDSAVYARPDPLTWIGPGRRGAVRLTQWHDGTTQIEASHDLLRVKSFHAGVSGRADTSGETLVGGYIEYRF